MSRCIDTCRKPVGYSQCHCTGCHRTFRNVSGFEAHWVGRGDDRHCIDPSDFPSLGLIERDRMWATPEGHTRAAQLAAYLPIPKSRAASQIDRGRYGDD